MVSMSNGSGFYNIEGFKVETVLKIFLIMKGPYPGSNDVMIIRLSKWTRHIIL